MSELPRTIVAAAEALRNGTLSAVSLTETLLARAHAANDALGAFVQIADETALAAARAADADFAAGVDRGPLQGIPLAIKDIIATEDAPTTANSRVMDPAWGRREDATVMRKLRQAGAIMLGKTVLHEYACGWPDAETGFPMPKNPWDLARTAGGSSSGTGIAVAADLAIAGLGTDTGGSIRGPSAFCGLSGIKQTFGLVSKEGCVPLGYSLDHIGPMAHTVRDCAVMLQVMAGYDSKDPTTVDRPVPDLLASMDGSLEGVRIGVPHDYFFTAPGLEPEVKQGVLDAIEAMKAAGATVTEVRVPFVAEAQHALWATMGSEALAYHEPDLRAKSTLYGRYTREALQVGLLYSGADYVQAQRVRSIIKAGCLALFRPALGADGDGVDVLITPSRPTVAPILAGYDTDFLFLGTNFSGIWNVTGQPALCIPCGFAPTSGMPLSMQIVGRPFDEPTVFKVGDAYQRMTDWHLRKPTPVWEAQPA
jgi:aspartyl-tRNA(Asn)/glutamyl-tRNA(Gln) amidotransferase subunit A